MSAKQPFPHVEVAVAIVTDGTRILTQYNPKWGAYCLPMSKRRGWHDPNADAGTHVENWMDAAIRARTECVVGTLTSDADFRLEIPEFQQSDRDGNWKGFCFQVFRFKHDGGQLAPGANVEWLTPEELLDERRRPISKTTRDLIAKTKAEAQLKGEVFP